jgi:hypothetical protein
MDKPASRFGIKGLLGIIGEASFFTHAFEEKRLKNKEYNILEARAYYMAIKEYFSIVPQPVIIKFHRSIFLHSPYYKRPKEWIL